MRATYISVARHSAHTLSVMASVQIVRYLRTRRRSKDLAALEVAEDRARVGTELAVCSKVHALKMMSNTVKEHTCNLQLQCNTNLL